MDPEICEDCLQRTLKNRSGAAFNPTANPIDDGLDQLLECTSSFQPIRSYFSVYVMRCRHCGALWLLGYYEDFDVVPVMAEWGVRKWVWRQLNADHVARIEASRGTQSLDLEEFATAPWTGRRNGHPPVHHQARPSRSNAKKGTQMKDEVMKHFEALSELMPGVGIVLIPEDEEMPLRTNISSIEDGTRVMQHLAAVILCSRVENCTTPCSIPSKEQRVVMHSSATFNPGVVIPRLREPALPSNATPRPPAFPGRSNAAELDRRTR